jgi:GTPase SAR1 family protein
VTDIQRLLVVAGPAGAGKSTFMRLLADEHLTREIAEALPTGAGNWPRITANDIDAKGVALLLRRLNGASLVLHYNTMRPYSRGFGDYLSDPALKALDGIASSVTVVTLVPEPKLLRKQYWARLAEGNEEEWWVPTPLLKIFRRKIRVLVRERLGRTQETLKPDQLRLIKLYETPKALDQWSASWEAYLEYLRQQRLEVQLLFVAPCPGSAGHSRFSLVHSAKMNPS